MTRRRETLVEELPVNSEDEVAALGELPMVIHDKEVVTLVEELPVNSEDEWGWQPLMSCQQTPRRRMWQPVLPTLGKTFRQVQRKNLAAEKKSGPLLNLFF
jgi:hypothetical protein